MTEVTIENYKDHLLALIDGHIENLEECKTPTEAFWTNYWFVSAFTGMNEELYKCFMGDREE